MENKKQKVKNTTGHRRGSNAFKLKSYAVLFALLDTLTDYELTAIPNLPLRLSVTVFEFQEIFTAENLYDFTQPLADWIGQLPKDVWQKHGEVIGVLSVQPSKLFIKN